MGFERTERSDQDAGSRFLADAPPIPPLLEGPLLQRLLPAEDVPNARAAGGTKAAYGEDRAPYHLACVLNARAGLISRSETYPASDPRSRCVKGAQRVELCDGEAISKILTGSPHLRGNRTPSLHRRKCVYEAIGAAGTSGTVA